jgi:hypothetical protein
MKNEQIKVLDAILDSIQELVISASSKAHKYEKSGNLSAACNQSDIAVCMSELGRSINNKKIELLNLEFSKLTNQDQPNEH